MRGLCLVALIVMLLGFFVVHVHAGTVVSSPETITISARVGEDLQEEEGPTGSYPFGTIPIIPEVVVSPTAISFSGNFFSLANVVVLKDGQDFLSGNANAQGNFFLIKSGLTPGVYMFSVFVELPSGRRILVNTFHVVIKQGMYVKIENITLSQTLLNQIFPQAHTVNLGSYCSSLPADLNCDSRVDLIDLSILQYWYRTGLYSKYKDLNKDGKIELGDFSIMAYYWTA